MAIPPIHSSSNLPGSWTVVGSNTDWNNTYTISTTGTIKCDDVVLDDVSFKQLVNQLATMVPIFIPPDNIVMNNDAVKNAYAAYMEARTALVAKRAYLDLLIKLAQE